MEAMYDGGNFMVQGDVADRGIAGPSMLWGRLPKSFCLFECM